jgi:hypothetical protein
MPPRRRLNGGRGGIRTPDTLSGTPVFKTGAINHSATLPSPHDKSAAFFATRRIAQHTFAAGVRDPSQHGRCFRCDHSRAGSASPGCRPFATRSAIQPWISDSSHPIALPPAIETWRGNVPFPTRLYMVLLDSPVWLLTSGNLMNRCCSIAASSCLMPF